MPRKSERFWNRHARRYAASPVANPAAYQHKLDHTASHFTPDARVLEIGCGTGTTALIHAPKVGHVDALDFSDAMIAIARQKAADAAIANVTFSVSRIEDWPIPAPGHGYDIALAMSVLHLVEDIDATLARLFAMLKPGGLLCSSTVCVRGMGRLVAALLPIAGRTGLIPRVRPLSEAQLLAHIREAGFEVIYQWKPQTGHSLYVEARRPATGQSPA